MHISISLTCDCRTLNQIYDFITSSIFDENRPTYAPELPIAVRAHAALSKNWEQGSSVKNQIMVWVKQFYSALSESARERIGMVSNWDKSGGSPVTPSKS